MSRLTAIRTFSSAAALLLFAAAPLAIAGPKDDVQAGVQKLDDAASYSWTTTNTGGRAGGGMDGKTQKDGATLLTMQTRNGQMQVVMQGDQVVAQTQDGWQNLSEMENAQGPGQFMARMLRNVSTPAAQAKKYLEGAPADLTKGDDGSYSADLSEETAKSLLTFGGGRRGGAGGAGGGGAAAGGAGGGGGPQVSNAKATGTFWLGSDGMLSKMQLHLTGTVSFNGNDRDIDRTTTTEIKDVGSTTVDIPADAKAKLSGGGGATTQPM